MPTGTVKWFNLLKGYGFIVPDDSTADVFVHVSAVERAGVKALTEGDKVTYELTSNDGKICADALVVLKNRE